MARRISLLALALCIAGAGVLLGEGGVPVHAQAAEGRIRVVHMAPHDPGVDVVVDGQHAVPDLTFRSASSYLTLAAGQHSLQLTPSGAAPPLVNQPLDIRSGQDQTVVALGVPPTVEDIVLTDDNQPPAQGMAKVRFVHAGADVPAVDIAVTDGPTLFRNVGFKDVAGPVAVPAGTYALQVRAAGTSTTLLTLPSVTLTDGQNVTLFGAGLRSDNTLTVVVLPYAAAADPPASTPGSATVTATTPIMSVSGLVSAGMGGALATNADVAGWFVFLAVLALGGAGVAWVGARRA